MALSLTLLTTAAQDILSDPTGAIWSDALITQWGRDAIADFSIYIPRIMEDTITTVSGTKKYNLSLFFQEMVIVEYPTNQSPAEYLTKHNHTKADFWNVAGYYDIINYADGANQSHIVISESPSSGQTITIIFKADHDYNVNANSAITVPERYHDILIMYIVWRASLERLSNEEQSPTDSTGLLMEQFAKDTESRRAMYVESLARVIQNRP